MPCLYGSVMPVSSFWVAQSTVMGGGRAEPTCTCQHTRVKQQPNEGKLFVLMLLCCPCVLVSALAWEARLFVSPLKSAAWPLNYTRDTCNKKSICSLFNHATYPMIRLQLEEAVLFWHWRGILFTDLDSIYRLLTALPFNDNAVTQRFLNSS